MPISHTCPKCSGNMTAGAVLDVGYGSTTVAKWVEGKPAKSIWTGLKLRGKRQLEIETRRCNRCGYLESFAPA